MTKKDNWTNKNINSFKTDYRRNYQASPFFEFSSPEISTTGSWIIDIGEEKPEARKHLPMSNVRIVNNSTENITFFPNQRSEGMNIPSGTIISFDRISIQGLSSMKFVNLGTSAVAENSIKVSVWREGVEIDGAFERMHKAFYERFLFPSRAGSSKLV